MENRQISVLIIESDKPVRDLISLVLSRLGFNAIIASDVSEAVEAFKAHNVGLVVSDIRMPQSDGFDLIRILREISSPNPVPVIVVSSLGYGEVVRKVKAVGARSFLLKPFSADELIQHIQAALAVPTQRKAVPVISPT